MPDTQRFEEARHHVVRSDRRHELRHKLGQLIKAFTREQGLEG
jgi:hypothetical protein